MNNRINTRIAAMSAALQRRQMEQAMPVDGLSRSLFAFEKEMAALDEQGKEKLLAALNNPDDGETDCLNLTLEDIECWIEKIKEG